MRRLAAVCVIATSLVATSMIGSAHAEAPQLAEARTAMSEVRFDDALTLSIAALEAGGNEPAAVREIYRMLAHASAALGRREDAVSYDKLWLVLDPDAALPAGTSPKLQEPFDEAKAWFMGAGPLVATASRHGNGELTVTIERDPLAVVHAVRVGIETLPFDGRKHRSTMTLGPVALLDRHGNAIHELVPAEALVTPDATRPLPAGPRPMPMPPRGGPSTAFYALAIPTGILLLGSLGAGVTSIALHDDLRRSLDDSGDHFYTDIQAKQDRVTLFWKLSAVLGGASLALAIPTAIVWRRDSRATAMATAIVPHADASSAGVSVVGRF